MNCLGYDLNRTLRGLIKWQRQKDQLLGIVSASQPELECSRRLDREGERIESIKPCCSALTGDFQVQILVHILSKIHEQDLGLSGDFSSDFFRQPSPGCAITLHATVLLRNCQPENGNHTSKSV